MDLVASSPSVRNLTTVAFEKLRWDILAGKLRPQERLRIQALSERYDIGATAIREALSRLVTDGLVESEDQRGFTVVPVSRDDLVDLTQTRVQVEQMALRMAIERGDVDWETQVLGSLHRLSRTDPPTTPEKHAAWSLAHRQFHEALVAGCRSPWTIRLCRLLYDKSERYRNLAEQPTHQRGRDVGTEHKALMDLAITRDAEGTCRLIDQHFWETTNIILDAGFDSGRTPRKATP